MPPVRLPRHHVVRDLIRRLGNVRVESGRRLCRRRRGVVRIGEVRRLAHGIAVDAHLSVKVVRGVESAIRNGAVRAATSMIAMSCTDLDMNGQLTGI